MLITDLQPGLAITLIVQINSERMEFESEILEVIPRKRIVLAKPVYQNDKVISFRAKNLIVDILVTFTDEKPQIFKNVTVSLVKKADDSIYYNLQSIAESRVYNRRNHFRCYIGISVNIQYGANRSTCPAILKDISAEGFGFVCSNENEFYMEQVVHTVFKDYIEELNENFVFHIYGIITRAVPLDENRTIYGCRLNNKVPGLETYIMKKDRLRIFKSGGRRN